MGRQSAKLGGRILGKVSIGGYSRPLHAVLGRNWRMRSRQMRGILGPLGRAKIGVPPVYIASSECHGCIVFRSDVYGAVFICVLIFRCGLVC